MPVALGVMQSGKINVYDNTTTIISASPTDGYCVDTMTFVIEVANIQASSIASTTIAVGSNDVSLPQTIIHVASTAGFPTSGSIYIGTVNTTVNYTGITSNTFTGCTGGSGLIFTGYTVSYSLAPQGTITLSDPNFGIPTGGTGTLSPYGLFSSRITLNPVWPFGVYNIVANYSGKVGGTDTLHQFKITQSNALNYVVNQVPTTATISGPASFPAINSVSYTINIISSHGANPSEGTVTLVAVQAGTHGGIPFSVGTGTPVGGLISITIAANTFRPGTSVTLTAQYSDIIPSDILGGLPLVGCYDSCVSPTITVNPIG